MPSKLRPWVLLFLTSFFFQSGTCTAAKVRPHLRWGQTNATVYVTVEVKSLPNCDSAGQVCKDGISCTGRRACQEANIGMVMEGCNEAWACMHAGDGGGSIGEVINSCHGMEACYGAAYGGGRIDRIVDSCSGEYACEYAADGGGVIGNLQNACNADLACTYAAYGGAIGNIQNACNANSACYAAGEYVAQGVISGLFDCCNLAETCQYAASLPESCPVSYPRAQTALIHNGEVG